MTLWQFFFLNWAGFPTFCFYLGVIHKWPPRCHSFVQKGRLPLDNDVAIIWPSQPSAYRRDVIYELPLTCRLWSWGWDIFSCSPRASARRRSASGSRRARTRLVKSLKIPLSRSIDWMDLNWKGSSFQYWMNSFLLLQDFVEVKVLLTSFWQPCN